jgi:hypothetical protein
LSTPNSSAHEHAIQQNRRLQRDLAEYRKSLPTNSRLVGGVGICRSDGWDISYQQLSGEFDLDEFLGKSMIASAQASSPKATEARWMEQYLLGDVTGDIGTEIRLNSELNNAAAGPGNILGNLNAIKLAGNAAVQTGTTEALQAAARKIESGASRSIKINEYMTLYNANKSGKGRPRPRVRISGMPMRVISPALNQGMRAAASGANAAMKSADLLAARKMGNLASANHWTSKAAFFNGKIGGGILTFAPSAALDIYSSIERDMAGDLRFNRNKFLIASAKSQSGNLLGLVGGAGFIAFGTIIFGGAALAGAPIILIALVGGVLVQATWGSTGGADWAGSAAEHALKP